MMDIVNICIFLIDDNDLLEKYSTIWDIISADIKKRILKYKNKEFDSKLVYNKEYSKTKIKSHSDELTNFYDKKYFQVRLQSYFFSSN